MANSDLILPPGLARSRPGEPETFTPQEMEVIKAFHTIAQRHEMGLFCARCRCMFQGRNAETDSTLSIECQCREIRAVNRNQRKIIV